MEVIRKFIDANRLMSIMTLPEAFRNQKLEVIVLPTDEPEQTSEEQTKYIQTIVQSLVGSIQHPDLPLNALRDERLKKYEVAY